MSYNKSPLGMSNADKLSKGIVSYNNSPLGMSNADKLSKGIMSYNNSPVGINSYVGDGQGTLIV